MLRKLLFLLMLVMAFNVIAFENIKTIDVIAIEYPPFTTLEQPDRGVAFELLNTIKHNTKQDTKLQWNPIFLPPKRAYKTIESGNWCASFYPIYGQSQFTQYQLNKEPISIGLVRLSKVKSFAWSSLDELSGMSVALLRTGTNSDFVNKFKEAGLEVAYVETVQAAIQMVLLDRVDTAIIDNISYTHLEYDNRKKLQLSETSLIETKISIYINNSCGVSLPRLKIIPPIN